MAWREGEQVGPYQIVSQIGQGGMATVYKANHQQLGRTVAIKVMHQMFLDDETFVARFKREAQIVALLDHPHIIPIYDYNEHENQPYLVMRYVPGVTLKQRLIKRGPLPLDDILSLMNAVGGALSYAHSKGVLHRDVKPSNIVLDGDVPYLTDFGLARIAEAGESTMSADMVLGTPHYISPEQASGRKDIDGRADIYSLGVVLYELLVGRVPFTADTAYAIIHDQIYTPIPRPSRINPEIPQAVEDVLIRATEKQPSDRYTTADEMIEELKQAIEESQLTELSEERASIASESLARYRSEFAGAFGNMPSSTIAQPIPSASTSYRTASVYQSKAVPRHGRAWMMGGCGAFLFIAFVIASLTLSSISYVYELQEISKRIESNGEGHSFQMMFGGAEGLFSSDMESSELFTFLNMNESADTIQFNTAPDPAFAHLATAAVTWKTNPAESYAQVAEGKKRSTDVVRYLTLAALTADSLGDTEAALTYAVLALYEAHNDTDRPGIYEALRPIGGKYLYERPAKDLPENNTTFKTVADTLYEPDEVTAIEDSPFARFLTARVRLLAGNNALAWRAINVRIDETDFEAEIRLLRGEILAAQDKIGDAEALWLTLSLAEDIPQWVQAQALTHLTENKNS